MSISKFNSKTPDSCEYLGISIKSSDDHPYKLHILYHPPGKNAVFTDQLMEIITTNLAPHSNDIFLGDFNPHWEDPLDKQVNAIKIFLADHSLIQACSNPTHSK